MHGDVLETWDRFAGEGEQVVARARTMVCQCPVGGITHDPRY
jgi:hypothetical protein